MFLAICEDCIFLADQPPVMQRECTSSLLLEIGPFDQVSRKRRACFDLMRVFEERD
jgi:hypothetical protein